MQITNNSPASAHLLDLTRTVSRAHLHATGIDRIERAYLSCFLEIETPLFGLIRTKLGYLLLDRAGCRELNDQCQSHQWTKRDILSALSRASHPGHAATETGLRRIAFDRSVPSRLSKMLRRHLSAGAVYFNVGHSNFSDRVIHAVKACPESRIATFLHDTIPLDHPEYQTQKSQLKFKRLFSRVDGHADLVLCNSQDTRRHILRHARIKSDGDIHVLYPGIPEMSIGTAPDGPWKDRPYFVAVGTIEPRKNISLLLDIWEDFQDSNAPHLILCGRRGWMSEAVFSRLDQSQPNVHELGDLSDAQLWALLENSAGLLFPSLAEGFGYPAIEAAQLHVPILCNSLPVFHEVLGDYPIYADAADRYLWTNAIKKLAQRRRDQSGEQFQTPGAFRAPSWQAHFNQLFTIL